MAERIDSLMAVIADRVKTHPSHSSTIADDVERIDNEAELIVTNPTTISLKGKTGGEGGGRTRCVRFERIGVFGLHCRLPFSAPHIKHPAFHF